MGNRPSAHTTPHRQNPTPDWNAIHFATLLVHRGTIPRDRFERASPMTRFLLASATALATMTGVAMAQSPGQATTVQQTTTYTQPTTPTVVSSGVTNGTAVRSDGDQTASSGVSSANSAGDRTMTTVTNTTYPLAPYVRTTPDQYARCEWCCDRDCNDHRHLPGLGRNPPQVSTTTRNYVVGSR